MYNKIFFQTGSASRNDGWGILVNDCTNLGIPVSACTSDGTAMILDLQISRIQTGIQHEYSFIPTLDSNGNRFDMDYTVYATHDEAVTAYQNNAITKWDRAEAVIPQELDSHTLISLGNEQRPYLGWGSRDAPDDPAWSERIPGFTGWADSMGLQAYYIGLEALKRNRRYFAFSFAGGNPEPGVWDAPGMLQYLTLCEQNSYSLGVALHEYSFADTLLESWDTHIGRFKQLHATCDNHGIARPLIIIKEFGWRERDIPSDAIEQIPMAAELYAQYPNILGAAIWTCQNGWEPASSKAVSMIPEINEFTKNWRSENNPQQPGDGNARIPYNRTYVRVNSNATLEQWLSVAQWAYENRFTVGMSADDAGIGNGLGHKKVIEIGNEYPDIDQWYFEHYGVTDVEHRPY